MITPLFPTQMKKSTQILQKLIVNQNDALNIKDFLAQSCSPFEHFKKLAPNIPDIMNGI